MTGARLRLGQLPTGFGRATRNRCQAGDNVQDAQQKAPAEERPWVNEAAMSLASLRESRTL